MINIVQYAILSEKLPEKSPFLLYIFRPVNFWHGYYATGNRDYLFRDLPSWHLFYILLIWNYMKHLSNDN